MLLPLNASSAVEVQCCRQIIHGLNLKFLDLFVDGLHANQSLIGSGLTCVLLWAWKACHLQIGVIIWLHSVPFLGHSCQGAMSPFLFVKNCHDCVEELSSF